jgi:hypothetical protein
MARSTSVTFHRQPPAVRSMVLENGMSEADADRQLEQPQKYYEVTLVGRDMQPFAGLDEGTLKDSTPAVAKKSKEKVSPENVHISVGPDGKTVQGVTFSFPKTSASGQAVLGADEKGALRSVLLLPARSSRRASLSPDGGQGGPQSVSAIRLRA